jgi:hypothetical protein
MSDSPETIGHQPDSDITFEEWIFATLQMCERPATERESSFCPEWWKHPEAVARFKSLYIEYVKACSSNELSSWWIHHWDAHARTLFDPTTGVFRNCAYGHSPQEGTVATTIMGRVPQEPTYDEAVESGDPCWF